MPPDDNAAVDPTGAAWVAWLVIVGPALLFVTLTCLRRVAAGELVLVLRQDRVVRVQRRGFVARWPGVERFETVPTSRRVLPLVVRARTSDGVDVTALAELTIRVHDVAAGTAYVPTSEVVRLAEDAVAGAIAGLEVGSLLDELDALEPQWPERLNPRLSPGTGATGLTVTEVEARLTGGAP
jgi:hypothetical protein